MSEVGDCFGWVTEGFTDTIFHFTFKVNEKKSGGFVIFIELTLLGKII